MKIRKYVSVHAIFEMFQIEDLAETKAWLVENVNKENNQTIIHDTDANLLLLGNYYEYRKDAVTFEAVGVMRVGDYIVRNSDGSIRVDHGKAHRLADLIELKGYDAQRSELHSEGSGDSGVEADV